MQLYAITSQNNNIVTNNSDFFPKYEKRSISINGFKVILAIASSDEQRIKGLSGSEKLDESEGMLFLFDKPSKQGFWMKEMNYPIDIIWLDSNNTVIHIKKNLEPCKIFFVCPIYNPPSDALNVIELRDGFSNRHAIKNGLIIDLNQTMFN